MSYKSKILLNPNVSYMPKGVLKLISIYSGGRTITVRFRADKKRYTNKQEVTRLASMIFAGVVEYNAYKIRIDRIKVTYLEEEEFEDYSLVTAEGEISYL